MIKENEIAMSADKNIIFNKNQNMDLYILHYGVIDYIDLKTNERKNYISAFAASPEFVGYALNIKNKEDIQVLNITIKCGLYYTKFFETLKNEEIFISKENRIQIKTNKNSFTDDDKVILVETTKILPKGIRRKNFKTDKEFDCEIKKATEIFIEPIHLIEFIEDIKRLSKSKFISIPIVDIDNYNTEIDNFINSNDFEYFKEIIYKAKEEKVHFLEKLYKLVSEEDF